MEQSTNRTNTAELQHTNSGMNVTEHAIKQSADELLKWLSGTNTFFIKSIKALEERSTDPDVFRSYVTERLFDELSRMEEIANLYAREEEEQIQADGKKVRKPRMPHIDACELARFYHTVIDRMIVVNKETFDEMRMKIDAMKLMSKGADDFGRMLSAYIFYRVIESQTMPVHKQAGYLLCLLLAVKFHPYEEMGRYGDTIKDIISDFSTAVCMVVTKDYEEAIRPPRKEEEKGK